MIKFIQKELEDASEKMCRLSKITLFLSELKERIQNGEKPEDIILFRNKLYPKNEFTENYPFVNVMLNNNDVFSLKRKPVRRPVKNEEEARQFLDKSFKIRDISYKIKGYSPIQFFYWSDFLGKCYNLSFEHIFRDSDGVIGVTE